MSARRPGSFLATAAIIGALLAGGAGAARAGTGATQSGGTWHNVVTLKGPSGGVQVDINSVACPSPGNCTAGGSYTAPSGRTQPMVITETAGHWGKAIALPGTTAKAGSGRVAAVSCPSAGN